MAATLETAWTSFSNELRAFIRKRVNDDPAADDILQDTFAKLQKRLASPPELASISGWLHLVARRAIVDHYRARKPAIELSEALPAEAEVPDDSEGLCAAFRRMVETLPEPYREAVLLTDLEGVTQAELARRLGISLSGAKSRVQRGRAQLRQNLEDCCLFDRDHLGRVIGAEPRKPENCPECR